jgi:hypothetical protein
LIDFSSGFFVVNLSPKSAGENLIDVGKIYVISCSRTGKLENY